MVLFDGLHCLGGSICRLRILADPAGSGRVVIATDLEDSPGPGITNALEDLVSTVSRDFGEEPTRWLLHHPELKDSGLETSTWTEAVPGLDGPEWRPGISRAEAEAISGLDLSKADEELSTLKGLAGDRSLLASLAVGPDPPRLPGSYMRATPVAALPFSHGPFKCPHEGRFEEIAKFYGSNDRTIVGAHWFLTLTQEDFERCEYHKDDWERIAEASLTVLNAIGPESTKDDILAACEAQPLPERELKALVSLFREPIDWTPGSAELTNGQHRSCAMRAAGVHFCAVDTSGYPPPTEYPASARAAASAVLASYWAAKAASE